jgi:hypothetical protein
VRQVVLSRPLPPRRAVRPIPEVNRETYHALGRLAADINAIARRMAERRREPGAPEVLEALELVTPWDFGLRPVRNERPRFDERAPTTAEDLP